MIFGEVRSILQLMVTAPIVSICRHLDFYPTGWLSSRSCYKDWGGI